MHSSALLTVLFSALAAASPVAQVAGGTGSALEPNPNEIQIVSASYSGNGCPSNSATTTFSPDKTIVTFGFNSFQTYIGPGTAPSDRTKQCQLHLSLKYPAGFQFSIVDSTYHGYAQLDKGVTGTFFSTVYFSQDASASSSVSNTLSGPSWVNGGVYELNEKIATLVYSPCGAAGILNANNRIALTSSNATASGSISDDDATIAFTQQLHFNWRKC